MRLGLALLLALAVWAVGCAGLAEAPELLEVSAIHPSAAEVGDRLELIGNGFPEGRAGTATLEGELFRPGASPVRTSGIVARVAAASRRRVLLDIDGELVAAFCGRGGNARHTTFRGSVLVAFAPHRAGAAKVAGRLDDVELDFSPPPPRDEVVEQHLAAGRVALDSLGLTVSRAEPRGLRVTAVLPDGRAARAGIEPRDTLLAFAELRLADESDLALAPGARSAVVRLERGRPDNRLERTVDLEGLSPLPPSSLGVPGLLVAVAVGAMLLLAVPFGRLLTWTERRVVARIHAAESGLAGQASRRRGRRLLGLVVQALLPEELPALLRVLPYLEFLGVTVLATLLAFDGVLVAPEVDLPLGVLGVTTGLVCVGVVAGGRLRGPYWSLLAGLGTGLRLIGQELPLVATLTSVVLSVGSTRIRDLVVAQGASPWRWHAFTSPAAALGTLLVVATLIPRPTLGSRELSELELPAASPSPASRAALALLAAADVGHLLVVTSLLSLVLLGGYTLPGVSPTAALGDLPLEALGALVVAVKTGVLLLIVAALRVLVPLVYDEARGPFWRAVPPASLAVVGLAVAWEQGVAPPLLHAAAGGLGIVLSALTAFVVAFLALRVARSLRRPTLQISVNPWL